MIVGLLIVSAGVLSAQNAVVALPYIDSFEDVDASSDWELNTGPAGSTLVNKWCVSDKVAYIGSKSLIISNDNGVSAMYSNVKNISVSYRVFDLPSGDYELSFAWRAMGERIDKDPDPNKDGLYVCWMPASMTSNSIASFGSMQQWVNTYAISFNGTKMLRGSSEWKTESEVIKHPGGKYKLVFVWKNDAKNEYGPAACVDFIQIAPKSACPKPTNLSAAVDNNNDVTFSWIGSSVSYEVMYRAYGSEEAHVMREISITQVKLTDLEEGVYDFFVRGVCGGDTSVWTSTTNCRIYRSDSHCIDYINLKAAGTVCATGTYKEPAKNKDKKPVDFGYLSEKSRHTVHWMPGETDPRTRGMLKTVPDGEVASVRLGNWLTGGEAERITYKLTLDSADLIIMLVKYAIVFEAPGHGLKEDPVFQFEILDENGRLVDAKCGAAEFVADVKSEGSNGFHVTRDLQINPDNPVEGDISSGLKRDYIYGDIVWKDWTTIGLDLTSYAGQTIQIRCTSKDCAQSKHFGYCYFVLDCSPCQISGQSCGEVQTANVSAPDGFNYEWYRKYEPEKGVVCRTQNLSVPGTDTATYVCNVISKAEASCSFPLEVCLLPHNPKSQCQPKWSPSNCENRVLFRNTSCIVTERGSTGQRPETIQWIVDGELKSTDWDYTLLAPNEGGTYRVELVSGISNDKCVDRYDTLIVVPSIVIDDTTRIYQQISSTGRFPDIGDYNGKVYTAEDEGIHIITLRSFAGCDSIVKLDLSVLKDIHSEIYDTICEGETYEWIVSGVDQKPKKSGVYRKTEKSAMGIDSVVTLYLEVFDTLGVVLEPVVVCADDSVVSIPYEIESGVFTYCNVSFDDKGISQGFVNVDSVDVDSVVFSEGVITLPLPDGIRPDRYAVTLFFSDSRCGQYTDTIEMYIKYASAIIEQKFNDVLALLSPAFNGGYEFESYQWFCNGAVIPDATGSYIYVGPESVLDLNAQYHASLVRKGETYAIESCPPELKLHTDNTVYIQQSVSLAGAPLYVGTLRSGTIAQWWTVGGIFMGDTVLYEPGGYVFAPNVTGVYLLRLVSDDGILIFKVVVR